MMILWNNDNIFVLLTTQVVRWIIFNENVSISIPISSPMKWEFEHHVLVISHSGYDLLSHLENIQVSSGRICYANGNLDNTRFGLDLHYPSLLHGKFSDHLNWNPLDTTIQHLLCISMCQPNVQIQCFCLSWPTLLGLDHYIHVQYYW